MTYSNGYLPRSALKRLWQAPQKEYLSIEAFKSFKAAAAELKRTTNKNLYLYITRMNSTQTSNGFGAAYRSYASQVYAKNVDPSSAYPGTSNHGLGNAIDLGNGGSYDVDVINVMKRYGWVRDAYTGSYPQGEPWHWHYVGGGTAGNDIKPIKAKEDKEDDMWLIEQKNGEHWAVVPSVFDVIVVSSDSAFNAMKRAGVRVEKDVAGSDIHELRDFLRRKAPKGTAFDAASINKD